MTGSFVATMLAEMQVIEAQLDECLALLEQMKHEGLAFAAETRAWDAARRRQTMEHSLTSRKAGSTG